MIATYLERESLHVPAVPRRLWVQRPPKTDSPPSLTTQRREVNTGDLSFRAAAVRVRQGAASVSPVSYAIRD